MNLAKVKIEDLNFARQQQPSANHSSPEELAMTRQPMPLSVSVG